MKTKPAENPSPLSTALPRTKSSNQTRAAALWERPRILKGVDNYNVVLAARQVTPQIIKRLIALTNDVHGPTAVKACEIILNRAYGRAPMIVDVTHKITADRAILEQAAAAILDRRRERAREAGDKLQTFDSPILLTESNRPAESDATTRGGSPGLGGVGRRKGSPPFNPPPKTIDVDIDNSVDRDKEPLAIKPGKRKKGMSKP